MNQLLALICVLSSSLVAGATEWRPSDDFLRAVKFVESSNGQFKIGDNGQSLGDFQLSEAAWLDVSQWRKARGLKTYEYDKAVFHSFINRVYASNYLTILYGELSRKLGREPDHGELYASHRSDVGVFFTHEASKVRISTGTTEGKLAAALPSDRIYIPGRSSVSTSSLYHSRCKSPAVAPACRTK